MSEETFAVHQKRVKGPRGGSYVTSLQVKAEMKGKLRKRKYKNEPTWVDGIRFDSKKEAKRYQELKLLQVVDLCMQVRYKLTVLGVHVCDYIADFMYWENGEKVVEDCKGVRTPVYNLKKKLMKAIYGIEIRET